MTKNKKFKQGYYKPLNPEKYDGDINNICARSSWEFFIFKWLDLNSAVLSWSSEPFSIQYQGFDGKPHRYFPDILVKIRKKSMLKHIEDKTIGENESETFLIEIKPYSQTEEGYRPPKRITEKNKRSVVEGALEVEKNRRKWEAAREFCRKNGMKFLVLTEKELFGK